MNVLSAKPVSIAQALRGEVAYFADFKKQCADRPADTSQPADGNCTLH